MIEKVGAGLPEPLSHPSPKPESGKSSLALRPPWVWPQIPDALTHEYSSGMPHTHSTGSPPGRRSHPIPVLAPTPHPHIFPSWLFPEGLCQGTHGPISPPPTWVRPRLTPSQFGSHEAQEGEGLCRPQTQQRSFGLEPVLIVENATNVKRKVK